MLLEGSEELVMGRVKLSKELVEERGEIERRLPERRWRGRRWPWEKISSAGDKSMAVAAAEEGEELLWLSLKTFLSAVVDGEVYREQTVKENSRDGEEETDVRDEPQLG